MTRTPLRAVPPWPGAGRTVVIGGGGQVGGLFTRLLGSRGTVVSVDRRRSVWVRSVIGDARDPSPDVLATVRSADILLLALPEDVAVEALTACAGAVRPGTLVVETLSVKERIADALARVAAERGFEACGLNPMFAPALGFARNAVAAVRVVDGPRTAVLLDLVATAGARVVEMSAAEHDRAAAMLQAATHAAVLAFGDVLAENDCDLATLLELAPPPHRTMLAMLARIVGGNPDVYWDIQSANPGAERARRGLREAVDRIGSLVLAGDRDGFAALLRGVDDYLGATGPELRDRCAALFTLADDGERTCENERFVT